MKARFEGSIREREIRTYSERNSLASTLLMGTTLLADEVMQGASFRARAGLNDVRIHDQLHKSMSTAVIASQGLPMIGKLREHTKVIQPSPPP
jgi:hypothetical protein